MLLHTYLFHVRLHASQQEGNAVGTTENQVKSFFESRLKMGVVQRAISRLVS